MREKKDKQEVLISQVWIPWLERRHEEELKFFEEGLKRNENKLSQKTNK